jgi:AraC-like DNA-binding protein
MHESALARMRQDVSPIRHGESPLRVFGLTAGPSGLVPPQPPGWSHLVTLRAGAAMVESGRVRTLLTPDLGLWLPAGVPYALDLRTRCDLRILYCAAGSAPVRAVGAVAPSALLRESIERATRCGYLDPARSRDAHLLAVMHDELAALTDAPRCTLPLPLDAALRAAVEHALGAPEEPPSVAALARAANVSTRTFERRFARETGLTPREWCRRARLIAAVVALAAGASVTEAGLACGYASLSAFISAYRTMFGTTPGRPRVAL